MVYRIDIQRYLMCAIDYFTRNELAHFQYAIISAAIKSGTRAPNVVKIPELYPTTEIVIAYEEYKDKKILEKMYFELLEPDKDGTNNWVANKIYRTFINPLLHHHDIMIICDEKENDYIDALCKFMEKNYAIEVIDLNELFIKGRVGPIHIDRDKIWDKAVDIRRMAGKDQIRELSRTSSGRMMLLKNMSKKDKLEKLKDLGIKITNKDKDELDQLLMDAWVEADDVSGGG